MTAFDLCRVFAIGADYALSARDFMFAVGCIQSRSCHSNHCPTGVATQSPLRQRALVVDDKAPRVANFHRNTMRALAELLGAAGLSHPDELKPWHLQIRHQSGAVLRGDDVYPHVAAGAIVEGKMSADLSREWRRASADSFDPAFARELALTWKPDRGLGAFVAQFHRHGLPTHGTGWYEVIFDNLKPCTVRDAGWETKMTDAVDMTHPIRHADRFFIGGEWVAPSSDSKIHVRDSTSEEVFLSVAEAQDADVDRAVAAAREAFDRGPWPRMSHRERAQWMNRIADEWVLRTKDFADSWTRESGILRWIADFAAGTADVFRYYASLAESFQWEEATTSQMGQPALLVREPVGVVGAIVPWNSTHAIIAYKVAPALIAGCTVVVKASPEAPASAYILAEICEKIGLPKGVINVLTADREVSELAGSPPRRGTRSPSPARPRPAAASPRSAANGSRG